MRAPSRPALVLVSLLALLASTLAVTAAAVALAPAASAATTDLRLNEVEPSAPNGGSDWVELTNLGTAPVDAGGLVLKDEGETNNLMIPAGTMVAPGGFTAIDVSGLGAGGDSARLFDGATRVDAFTWTAANATTFGRCPDGTGAFGDTATTAGTKGGANACAAAPPPPATLRINEVESSAPGGASDWVELTNTGAATVSAGGLVLKDDGESNNLTIPAGTMVAPGGFTAIDVSGLGGADSARLFSGSTLLDSVSWVAAAPTTFGRCPDGVGAFRTTTSSTKGAANDCAALPATGVVVNEVESNGGTPGDWVELRNTGAAPADLSGYAFRDADTSHALYRVPLGTVVAPGGYHLLEEAQFGFGLGSPDAATLFAPDGTTVVDSYAWSPHAVTTYGRCPDGGTTFTTTYSATKGAANDCRGPLLTINEVESDGGTPGDWVELVNFSAEPLDASGVTVRSSRDADAVSVPDGTTVPAGGYLVLDLPFDLQAVDAVRVLTAAGDPLDSYSWTSHAETTYGRCPDTTGALTTTARATKGRLNNCVGEPVTEAWPGSADVRTVDAAGFFGTNLSGLAYEGSGSSEPGVLWAVKNGTGTLYRLVEQDGAWVADGGDWAAGKTLLFEDGSDDPDAEGITLSATGSVGGIYVATERDNTPGTASRPAILRYDPATPGTSLSAVRDYDLTADLPTLGANAGLEGIAFVPDAYLTAGGFHDDRLGRPYAPADYPGHGSGLFLVGVEGNGMVYAYALDEAGNGYTRVASFASGFPGVMELQFDAELRALRVYCDDTCQGRQGVFDLGSDGRFVAETYYERPSGMPNLANEGFVAAPRSECVDGLKPVFWADDSGTGGHALRAGATTCTPRAEQRVRFDSVAPSGAVPGDRYRVSATGGASGKPIVFSVTTPSVCSIAGDLVTFDHAGTCVVRAEQDGGPDDLPGSAVQTSVVVPFGTSVSVSVTPSSVRAAVTSGGPSPAGRVAFSVDGVGIGSAPVVDGVAVLAAVVPPGAGRLVRAEYGGGDEAESTGSVLRRDPVVRATVASSGSRTPAGWYGDPVTVSFTCEATSGALAEGCPAPVVLDRSGADQEVTRTVVAADGGAATVSVTDLDLDLEAPSVRIGGVRDGAIYQGRAPSAFCDGSDALSGLAACRLSRTRHGDDTVVVATAVDRAGHVSSTRKRYTTLRSLINRARYDDGVFEVGRRRFTVVAYTTGATPSLLGPVGVGDRLRGPGAVFERVGREAGLVKWRYQVRLPGSVSGRRDLGVRRGRSVERVRVDLRP